MMRIDETLDCGTSHFAEGDRLWEWVKSSIQSPSILVTEIEAEGERRKAATIAAGRV